MKTKTRCFAIFWLSLIIFTGQSYALSYDILYVASKTIKISKASKNAKDILQASETWRKKFLEADANIRRANGMTDDVLTRMAKEKIVEELQDWLIKKLPESISGSIDILTENLAYRVVRNIFSTEEIASPSKELELLNDQVNEEVVNGLIRLYPIQMNAVLEKIKSISISR
jgi:hypothetical protein